MKGYLIPYGYIGYVTGHWMLFATESEYYEYLNDEYENLNDYLYKPYARNAIANIKKKEKENI